jgi:hypothetical protein
MFVFASSKTCLDTGCSCLLPQRHGWIQDVRVCFLKDMFGYWMFVFASSMTCLDTGCSCVLPQRHVWRLDVRAAKRKGSRALLKLDREDELLRRMFLAVCSALSVSLSMRATHGSAAPDSASFEAIADGGSGGGSGRVCARQARQQRTDSTRGQSFLLCKTPLRLLVRWGV